MADSHRGAGGELHLTTEGEGDHPPMTTNQGLPIADNQNSLKAGVRGPSLLEDHILREKITHFDHERIPERVVHARGSAAHGVFRCTKAMGHVTKAAFLSEVGKETEVFARFSTVAGSKGSTDLARDVRGFAVKFYTEAGNYDLVGNNIPVFFIQDAIKFPDLIHAVKPEPDREIPQAASAHDTFWDFISLTPESMHMIMWVMSDRAIPRSLRMMEGFGVHTFRLINEAGESHLCKFHWKPKLGMFSVLWDEAVKISGANSDYHRQDLWDAIDGGQSPVWELGLQILTQEEADALDYDVLDPTKLIPEEDFPVEIVGEMTLNRNPDNFFAETEQVAFCPSHVVPGIGFSNDPLLQGRLFSYLDTQLSRLGSPNFHQIPINKPRCPFHNNQRDAHMQTDVPTGRTAYDPNRLRKDSPRESQTLGYESFPEPMTGEKLRQRAKSFSDHYTQARLFYVSQTEVEQGHIRDAIAFELGMVDSRDIRRRVLSHVRHVDEALAEGIAKGLGLTDLPPKAEAQTPCKGGVKASEALSILKNAPKSLKGKDVGVLVAGDPPKALLDALEKALTKEGARMTLIAPTREGSWAGREADKALNAAPSVLFDAVVVAPGKGGAKALAEDPDARSFLQDAHRHLKAIGVATPGKGVLKAAGLEDTKGEGIFRLQVDGDGVKAFLKAAKGHRIWSREGDAKAQA